jgi:hypothetical protein
MCMLEASDGQCDVYREARPRALKSHQCWECQRDILPGERYLRTTMLYDGSWTTARMCEHCDAAAQWLREVCGGYLCGAVHEDLDEHRREHGWPVRTLSLQRLVWLMARRWRRHDAMVPVADVRRWAVEGARLACDL